MQSESRVPEVVSCQHVMTELNEPLVCKQYLQAPYEFFYFVATSTQ
jgi:hypothetical protein